MEVTFYTEFILSPEFSKKKKVDYLRGGSYKRDNIYQF